ncbi:MAG: putative NBD/HSP70 family sugar kinase [Myxococcota bacterium]
MSRGRRKGLSIERALLEVITSGATSRSDLALRLGASKATISRLVDQLIRNEWLGEGAPVRVAERGRNAIELLPRADLGYAVGADLEGMAIRVCLFDCQRNVIKSRRTQIDATWSIDRIVDHWRLLITEVIESADVSVDQLIALGLALPGAVPRGASSAGLEEVKGFSAQFDVDHAFGDLGVPIVTNDNTLCVADYERRFGVAQDTANFAAVLVRFGVGAAVFCRDHFAIGEDLPCSELGHVRVREDGDECFCGERGCLDASAAGRTWPEEVLRVGSQWDSDLTSRARDLGAGIGHLVKLIHVPVVVVNGIFNEYEDRIREDIDESLATVLNPLGLEVPEIRMGDQLEYKACLGAGLRAIDESLASYLAARQMPTAT